MEQLSGFLKYQVIQCGKTLEQAAQIAKSFAPTELVAVAVERVRKEIFEVTSMPDPAYLAAEDLLDWYPGPSESDRFWPPYRDSLARKNWKAEDVAALDRSSSRVLQLMRPPGIPEIRTRGLVVGYVQSGKTASYAATIAKAADVGYRLVVVLAGATNVLRRQTQERLDKDIIGHRRADWVPLTDAKHDFSGATLNAAAALTPSNNQRAIAVIKKNATRMSHLHGWLRSAGPALLNNCPILVIDDEADQGSPNSSIAVTERTTINRLLLALLRVGPKVAYIGYTATPFANLLIDPSDEEDLYPKDFIIDLPRPKSYFGPEKIFGREPLSADDAEAASGGLDMMRAVPLGDLDVLAQINSGELPEGGIPPSLTRAIRYFLLATAERHRRGQSAEHSSMLIHTSQRIVCHQNTRPLVVAEVERLRKACGEADDDVEADLRMLWEDEAGRAKEDAACTVGSYGEVRACLPRVLDATEVIVENSRADKRLDYATPGKVVIAIGGNVLSRGLTLEGLSVSYFVRTVSAYDTLLQMGRWFGYRSGYEDLPRIWMTDELAGFFFDLATVEAEIRREIARYEGDRTITPLKAGVRIRTHPQLAVTAKAKMRSAVHAAMSFRDRRIQTTLFATDDVNVLEANLAVACTLVAKANGESPFVYRQSCSGYVSRGVTAGVVREFLATYQFVPHAEFANTSLLRDYVARQVASGRLTTWNVAIATRTKNAYGTEVFGALGPIPTLRRTELRARSVPGVGKSVGALMSQRDVLLDTPVDFDLLSATGDFLKVRNGLVIDRALLILYPVAANAEPPAVVSGTQKRYSLAAKATVIGVALVFPNEEDGEPLQYITADLSQVPVEQVGTLADLGADEEDEE